MFTNITKDEQIIIKKFFEEKEYGFEYENDICYLDSHNRHLMLYKGDRFGFHSSDVWVIEYESGLTDQFVSLSEAINNGRNYFDFYWDKKVD